MVVALALALVMGAAGCVRKASPPITAASGPQVSSRAGMSAGAQVLWESDAQQDSDFAAIANAGARWLALDVDWNSIQGDGALSFRWDRAMDRAVLRARAHGLTILGIAAYSPPWARPANCPSGTTHCLPADPNAFGRFMAAAAQRYGSNSSIAALRGSITSWQIWNEPNHQEFAQPKPSPSQYTAMLKSAYVSIKSVDPTATVVTGGTAPAPDAADGTEYTPETWLRALYSNGARGFFDAVGHHPYAFPVNPLEPHPWNAYTQVAVLHVVMTAAGDGNKKIWGTEMGGPTGTDAGTLSEAQQSQWVHDYYLGWNTTYGEFTGPLIWMEIRDRGTNIGDKWQNMGLLRHNGQAKPAYAAFQQVMRSGVW